MLIIKQIQLFTISGCGWWGCFKMYADLSVPASLPIWAGWESRSDMCVSTSDTSCDVNFRVIQVRIWANCAVHGWGMSGLVFHPAPPCPQQPTQCLTLGHCRFSKWMDGRLPVLWELGKVSVFERALNNTEDTKVCVTALTQGGVLTCLACVRWTHSQNLIRMSALRDPDSTSEHPCRRFWNAPVLRFSGLKSVFDAWLCVVFSVSVPRHNSEIFWDERKPCQLRIIKPTYR